MRNVEEVKCVICKKKYKKYIASRNKITRGRFRSSHSTKTCSKKCAREYGTLMTGGRK